MGKTTSDLAEGLGELTRRTGGHRLKILEHFGDQPDVLDGIRQARDNGVSPCHIAEYLSDTTGTLFSENAVANWLKADRRRATGVE